MNEKHRPTMPIRLPKEWIDWLTHPFSRFMRVEAGAGAMLLLATVAALVLSNSPAARHVEAFWATSMGLRWGAIELIRPLRGWIDDALMTLFFFLVALELKRELVLGELRKPRVAALSIAGALGGMLVPDGLYLLLQSGRPGAAGWGTVMATDTAFVSGCLALLASASPSGCVSSCSRSRASTTSARCSGRDRLQPSDRLATACAGRAWPGGDTRAGVGGVAQPSALLHGRRAVVWIAVDASGVHATPPYPTLVPFHRKSTIGRRALRAVDPALLRTAPRRKLPVARPFASVVSGGSNRMA
ncbi:Na+/H+ antiporter NhaA [Frateuria terrea]|uniref:Na+/H+ antiporter NhaA n=1 Tax=Frateuria terrea TaxID=529704 RepID=UPI001C317DB6|nr:Na+/H+ antiporter NhaA [Frateuria terrea]